MARITFYLHIETSSLMIFPNQLEKEMQNCVPCATLINNGILRKMRICFNFFQFWYALTEVEPCPSSVLSPKRSIFNFTCHQSSTIQDWYMYMHTCVSNWVIQTTLQNTKSDFNTNNQNALTGSKLDFYSSNWYDGKHTLF